MKFDVKKFLILNFPYVFMFWFFDKVGEGYRLAAGADMVTKAMGAVSGLGEIDHAVSRKHKIGRRFTLARIRIQISAHKPS